MKITMNILREMIRDIIVETAKDGEIQKKYKDSFARMIKKASSGGNNNTPPFTEKASGPGKSGPDDSGYTE